MQILGVGIATLDIVNIVDHYPHEDEELRAKSQHVRRGGNTANTLTILSQFNHQCYWLGTLADDSNASSVADDFSRNKIDYSFHKKISHSRQPTSYIILNKTNGSRTIVHYRDLPELNFEHFKTVRLDNFDWIHFEARAIEETVLMVQWIKSQYPKTIISIEIEKPRENLQAIFNLADLYLFSKAYANETGFEQATEFLQQQKQFSPKANLVCSWGEQGAYALLNNGEDLFSEAFPPKKVVDTLGAGDTFNAALIHSRLSSDSWQDSLVFACKVAGKKCGQIGFDNLV